MSARKLLVLIALAGALTGCSSGSTGNGPGGEVPGPTQTSPPKPAAKQDACATYRALINVNATERPPISTQKRLWTECEAQRSREAAAQEPTCRELAVQQEVGEAGRTQAPSEREQNEMAKMRNEAEEAIKAHGCHEPAGMQSFTRDRGEPTK